jgi:hypothetical protein
MTKTKSEIKREAKKFVNDWQGKGEEIRDDVKFWNELLKVLGVDNPMDIIEKQYPVKSDNSQLRIDIYIKSCKVVIEQKGVNVDLDKKEKQSDTVLLTPLGQARRYYDLLDKPLQGRYYIACNFKEFRIIDTYDKQAGYNSILLTDLPDKIANLNFLAEAYTDESLKKKRERDENISKTASDFISNLYSELKTQYKKPSANDLHSLNVFCVRIVFCLFADDAGLFDNEQFRNFLSSYKANKLQEKFSILFNFLATNENKRKELDNYVDKTIKSFPYVNGGLFEDDKNYTTPKVTDKVYKMLTEQAYNLKIRGTDNNYYWRMISPTNFGCIFESTINKDIRDSGGMHYTTPENIHRVIEPLFLNDLRNELVDIINMPTDELAEQRKRNGALEEFRNKLSMLRFLDPACGSGNFLSETFIQLRKLEMQAMQYISDFERQTTLINHQGKSEFDLCKVQISQFYGIEIDDFAVSVARTAMWISECQMLKEEGDQLNQKIKTLPLKSNNNIVKADALLIDWNSILKPKRRSKNNPMYYVIGNPPFQGAKKMKGDQRKGLLHAMPSIIEAKKVWDRQGTLDFVCAWYAKTAEYMQGKNLEAAFVSTNSITQGEQEAPLWYPLINHYNVHILFAWKTFKWINEANSQASVSCVIIGLFNGKKGSRNCHLYRDDNDFIESKNINGYLMPKDDIFIWSRSKPLCNVPEIGIGNKPVDDGNYLFSENEKTNFIHEEPQSIKYFHRWYGAKEFLHNIKRYVLYLKDCDPHELNSMPKCMERVLAVENYRKDSQRGKDTQKLSKTPRKFHVENIPESDYMIIPRHSSENYTYIPMGYLSKDDYSGDAVQVLPNVSKPMFAVLESSLNMYWTAIIGGKIKSDYRYSKEVIHNNFPWPDLQSVQETLTSTANAILNVRNKYAGSDFSELYNDLTMPEELRKAHENNDKAVAKAFGFDLNIMSEEDIVMELAHRSMKLTAKLENQSKKKKSPKHIKTRKMKKQKNFTDK